MLIVQGAGHVFSSEVGSSSGLPIGRVYRHDTGLCWQATYSSTSGYGSWAQSETGPLGEHCGSVATATWYTQANALSNGATYTGAGTVSSGYMGILHMVHDSARGMVFGGELDGRTLGSWLAKGKPVEGEIYVVSTSNAVETLIATTETAVQSQLYSTALVDAGSVGGLTGSSAQALQTELGSFSTLWSHSATVAMAESQGFVEQRCPSNTSTAFIAIGCDKARETGFALDLRSIRDPQPAISLQRLETTAADLKLLLVSFRICSVNIVLIMG